MHLEIGIALWDSLKFDSFLLCTIEIGLCVNGRWKRLRRESETAWCGGTAKRFSGGRRMGEFRPTIVKPFTD